MGLMGGHSDAFSERQTAEISVTSSPADGILTQIKSTTGDRCVFWIHTDVTMLPNTELDPQPEEQTEL